MPSDAAAISLWVRGLPVPRAADDKPSFLEYLATQSKKVDKAVAITADDFLRLPEAGINIAKTCDDSIALANVSHAVSAARSVGSATRVINTIIYFISGQFFNETFINKVMRIILAVGRFLSPLAWLNRLKAINLGAHAIWINFTIMAAFTAAGIISLITSIRNWITSKTLLGPQVEIGKEKAGTPIYEYANKEKMIYALEQRPNPNGGGGENQYLYSDEEVQNIYNREVENYERSLGEIISDFFEVLCSPWENGIVLSNNIAFVIVGAILNFISATIKLLRL